MTVPGATSSPARPMPGYPASKLTFKGVLTPEQVDFIRRQYGSLIICPGYVSSFGSATDRWGRILIPAASISFWECKNKLKRWQTQSENELFSWWPEKMRAKGVEPITIGDVLDGLTKARWQVYRKAYDRASAVEAQTRRKRKQRAEAIAAAEQEDEELAAKSLLGFGSASSGS